MKKNLIFISLTILVLILSTTVSASSGRVKNNNNLKKHTIYDFNPYQFQGEIADVSETSGTISVSGMVIDIVTDIELKNTKLTTLLLDTKKRQQPVSFFKKGQTVEIVAFKFPNGAYVGSTIRLISKPNAEAKQEKKLQ